MFLTSSLNALLLLFWSALWLLGGIWLARAAFRLRTNEQIMIGIAAGWLVQNWLANLLALLMPVPAAFWVSAAVVFGAGLLFGLSEGWRALLRVPFSIPQLITFGLICIVFFGISRGLAIFDDFAHLPTVSIMAAGDIPPHFSLDPQVIYGYHHFLLLFQAQVMRIGGMTPWAALDVGRALSLAVAVMLAALFAQRLTHSALAGFLGGMVMAFGSGARWLLLFLPDWLVTRLGQDVQLIGSGIASGSNLAEALISDWAIQGAGPKPFPFAFANGIYPAGVVYALTANGSLTYVNILILLLTFNRWREDRRWGSWLAAVLSVIFIAVWGLLGEAELIAILAGWGLVVLAYLLIYRTFRLPPTLWRWLGVMTAGCGIGFVEGGTWTDLLVKTVERLTTGTAPSSYQTIGFKLSAPAVVSSHLGPLSLLDPAQLLVALFELGPVLLVLPLLVAFGLKAFRLRRWYEAATAASALFALALVFVQFTGSTGVRNTPRLYFFMPLCVVFAVPLVWMWAARRTARIKSLAAGLGMLLIMGGMVMFGVELIATQRPVTSYNLDLLDVRMASAYWNRLAPGALIFDADPFRATALFGRHTNSHYTWYAVKPEWRALVKSPDPFRLSQSGFSYIYLDNLYWDSLSPQIQQAFSADCVTKLDEVEDYMGNMRRLLDLRECK